MMATKKEGKPTEPNYTPRKTIDLPAKSDDIEELGRTYARHFTGGPLAALRVIRAADKSAGYERDFDLPGLMATLREQGEAVNAGNLGQAEAMLMNQATALQTLFARLAERGMANDAIAAFEANMRMALRAQSQCRATLETLAAIKNPSSVAFVRQANIAHGPQQVNNGTPAASRPRKNETMPNKLLEANDGERLDTGTASSAFGADSHLATVGEIDRTANARGKG
jgi:hypothetical protein